MNPLWLPLQILLEQYKGVWADYFEAIYDIFHQDFVRSKPIFRGKRLGLKRFPEHEGKSATFWHMISTGDQEEERVPDIRRCERIGWPKPIIDNSLDSCLKIWAEPKGKNKRIHIWFENEGYLVVLDDRGEYILPWTAFYIESEHQKKKYNNRWNRYKDNGV
ncbi:TPA: hypothetical protein ACPZQN_003803 [Yersinia enterocolitica]|uniref:Phage P1-related protein n=1 Tax=Yersinia mollaretii TaxID=33060 RepID=A0AA36LPY2_YERMO|nr:MULTISPECIES: hypothetical protein [Yersinia]UYJ85057.1 hypothetical protein N4W04_21595 [Yersinia enterocolitica]UYK14434.1 hypothetical protein N4224_21625 [Yersinia enterocolitica]CNI59165.1 Uncharacterised protein [Yersinia mollaretii]HDY4893899.1 hypothetical protein [Yersinia enterocolitica]HEN3468623.1 hypothetical protein [Yersinia enterocolitica]